MGIAVRIRAWLWERNITIKEFAEKIGTSGSNLGNKLSRDNFSVKELTEIANALDCDLEINFIDRNTGKPL